MKSRLNPEIQSWARQAAAGHFVKALGVRCPALGRLLEVSRAVYFVLSRIGAWGPVERAAGDARKN